MSTDIAATDRGTTIPLVDFAGFASRDPAARLATAAQFRDVLEAVGFCYVRNHGVPAPVVDDIFAQSRAFFALPDEVKVATRPSDAGSMLGYGGVGGQALEKGRPGATSRRSSRRGPTGPALECVWPPALPGPLREAVVAFQTAAIAACTQLMAAMAVSLGLPETYFAPFYRS